jgi:hypothetical protein
MPPPLLPEVLRVMILSFTVNFPLLKIPAPPKPSPLVMVMPEMVAATPGRTVKIL